MNLPLTKRLLSYVRRQYPNYVPQGDIERLIATETKNTPSYGARLMRKMREQGLVESREMKGHVHWKAAEPKEVKSFRVPDLNITKTVPVWE